MLFQLPSFLIFLMVVLCLTRVLQGPWIKIVLIGSSFIFYSFWNIHFIWILAFYIVIALVYVSTFSKINKLKFLFVLIVLIPLLFFKYTNFILQSVGVQHLLHIGLPLGISFITFTLISFIVDYSRSPHKRINLLDVSLYISFFPHLIAGPILRSHELIPQLSHIHVGWKNIRYNLPLFAIGMIKKVLIADQIASYIEPIFLQPQQYHFLELMTAAVGFTIQIYCDFSAYSDMAIAVAGMFGIRFPENFRSPYLAFSMTETWKRWHMTLSFWLRDYVFIPLVRYCRNSFPHLPILLTMLVSGLWHGASWNFVLWGALQGIIMMAESYLGYGKFISRHPQFKWMAIVINFIIWTFLLILFRCQSIAIAGDFYQGLLSVDPHYLGTVNMGVMGLSALVLLLHRFDQVNVIRNCAAKLPQPLLIPVLCIIILGCSLVAAQRPESFYYFDF
ncbi:MBOAT family O-acyltransferase [Celerinatantimonas sp. YJH-8]|uniref:MBOAT family O-acyltransferase n=1 Tax=Celerinatantimonas sp. YJH-8 TaxID=3228714 RepID=UPI0038C44225